MIREQTTCYQYNQLLMERTEKTIFFSHFFDSTQKKRILQRDIIIIKVNIVKRLQKGLEFARNI